MKLRSTALASDFKKSLPKFIKQESYYARNRPSQKGYKFPLFIKVLDINFTVLQYDDMSSVKNFDIIELIVAALPT